MFNMNGSIFKNIIISGNLNNANNSRFIECDIQAGGLVSVGFSKFSSCLLGGNISLQTSESTEFDNCFTAKFDNVTIDYQYPVGPTNTHFSKFAGELIVSGMNSNSYLNVSGDGKVTVDASCSGARVKLAGNIRYDDLGVGTVFTDNRIETANDTQNILNAIGLSETNVLIAVSNVPDDILAKVIDGTATFQIALKHILAYCNGQINRLAANYKYRNFDNTADVFEFDITAIPGGHIRSRTDLP